MEFRRFGVLFGVRIVGPDKVPAKIYDGTGITRVSFNQSAREDRSSSRMGQLAQVRVYNVAYLKAYHHAS